MWRRGERVFGFPSGIWTPRRFANLEQWLDAGQGVTLTSGKVSQWDDLSGNGNHATQSNAAIRPTVVTAGLNGQDTISFDRASLQEMDHSLRLQPAATVAFVAKNTSVGADYYALGSWGGVGTGIYIYALNAGETSWGSYANANIDAGATLTTFKRGVLVARAYTDMDLRTNGSSVTVTTGVSGYNGGAHIGGSGGFQQLNGEIAEIICYSRALSVAECVKIETYFTAKYAL